tara:strand:+ start:329 stop:469 length:141 start_codon:yes stop_codon:yes gene_type:complete
MISQQKILKTKRTKLTQKSEAVKHEKMKHHDKSTYKNFKEEVRYEN